MSENSKLCTGAAVGAVLGTAVAYLFFTQRGQVVRDNLEPAVDDLMREFNRFRGTVEKFGAMANDGLRALQEFQSARAQHGFPGSGTAH